MNKLKFYGNLIELVDVLKQYKLYDRIYEADQKFKIDLNNLFNLKSSKLSEYKNSFIKIDSLRQFVDGIRIDHENNIDLIFIMVENLIRNNIPIEGDIIKYIMDFIDDTIKQDNFLLSKVNIYSNCLLIDK